MTLGRTDFLDSEETGNEYLQAIREIEAFIRENFTKAIGYRAGAAQRKESYLRTLKPNYIRPLIAALEETGILNYSAKIRILDIASAGGYIGTSIVNTRKKRGFDTTLDCVDFTLPELSGGGTINVNNRIFDQLKEEYRLEGIFTHGDFKEYPELNYDYWIARHPDQAFFEVVNRLVNTKAELAPKAAILLPCDCHYDLIDPKIITGIERQHVILNSNLPAYMIPIEVKKQAMLEVDRAIARTINDKGIFEAKVVEFETGNAIIAIKINKE